MAFLGAIACEKEVDTPNWNQDPIFWFSGNINGMSHQMEAGVNGYYMHAGYKDSADLPREYYGHLTEESCPTCPENIKIRLRNFVEGALYHQDSSIALGAHPFLEPYAPQQPNARVVQFSTLLDSNQGQPIQVYWDFGDGQSSNELNPIHIYDLATAPTIATCSLYVAYSNGCATSSYQNIALGSTCYANFEADVSGYSVQFDANVQSGSAVTYTWDFGDGYYSSEVTPNHVYASSGVYNVKLTITDQASGCLSSYIHKVAIDSSACLANCHFEPKQVFVNNDWDQKNHMAIDFLDSQGRQWSSAYGPQPSSSAITIEQKEVYLINESGYPTYHIQGSVNCLLFSPDLADTLILDQSIYSFAVAR